MAQMCLARYSHLQDEPAEARVQRRRSDCLKTIPLQNTRSNQSSMFLVNISMVIHSSRCFSQTRLMNIRTTKIRDPYKCRPVPRGRRPQVSYYLKILELCFFSVLFQWEFLTINSDIFLFFRKQKLYNWQVGIIQITCNLDTVLQNCVMERIPPSCPCYEQESVAVHLFFKPYGDFA